MFAYASDPARFADWQHGVLVGRMEGSGGVRFVTKRRIGLATRTVTSLVTRCDPPASWRAEGVDGQVRAEADLTVRPLGPERARLTIAAGFSGRGIGQVLVPLAIRRAARAEMPANLAALRARLGAGQRLAGAARRA